MAGDDVIIIIRGENGQAVRAMRDTEGRLRDMRGRFVSEGSIMSGAMDRVTRSLGGVKGSIVPLAAAAAPLAAAFAPIAVKAGGAGLAVAAFGVAVAGQVSSLKEASEAQQKYQDAVVKSGRGSKQAAEAQRAATAALAGMPEATQRAAVGMQTLKDQYRDFSDSTAKFTMAPVEKSFTVLGEILPRLTPMVKGTSEQLDRLVTVAGGAVASPGFDALSEKVSKFANSALKDAVDGTIHFMRTLSEGDASGPIKAFMEYAEQNGPAVRETLSSLGDAVSTLVEAAADAGPGMLTLVNAAAGLVASFPPELITVMMQTAVALKAVSLAGAGVAAISGGLAAARTQILALGAASTAAGGGMAGLRAAFLSLGTAAKASIVVAGIAAVAVVLSQLSDIGKEAPPNVDRMTTSLGKLAQSGKLGGEAARVFGEDYEKLGESLRTLSRPSNLDKTQQFLTGLVGMDSTPVKEAKTDFNALDEALTNMVKGGKADLAKTALESTIKSLQKQGFTADEVRSQLDDYKATLADQAFEQELAAQSMGIFGQAAQDTSAKLEAQQQSADGLRASILALNDVNRSAHDAQTQFEGALDSLTESFAEHGATLNRDTEAGRANRDAMSAASAAQGELLATGIAAGDSLASMTGQSEKLRTEMMRLAVDAFGGNKQAATEYVNTLLGVPGDIATLVKLEREEALTGVREVQTALAATPGAKSIKVDALNGAAIAALEAVGLKVKQLPDGRTEVTAGGNALDRIDAVGRALAALNGKTATTYVKTVRLGGSSMYANKQVPAAATGGLFTGAAFRYADGGPVVGPGTGTSDDVPAPWLSNGEFVMKTAAVDKYGEKFMQSVNDGEFKGPGYAKGGKVTQAERDARAGLAGQFGMNRFAGAAGWQTNSFQKGLGAPSDLAGLVAALSKARTDIKGATSGGTETRLLRTLDAVGKRLIGQERALGRVNASLEKARDKLDSLKSAAASLSSSVKSGILTSANITRGANSGQPVTVASIMGGLTESRDKGSAFAQALKDLKKKGLDKGLIAEIAQAGTEGGGLETASALLGASGSEIKSLNKLRVDIIKSAGSAGATAADAMYGAGIKAAEGLVKGLQSKQDAIEKQMMRIAKSMETAIKKALGIKSPSKVMEEVGDFTAEGFAVGVQKNRSVQPAWASMLNTPRGGTTAGKRADMVGGGRQVIEVVLNLDGQTVARQIFDPLRKETRTRGVALDGR